MNFSVLQKLFCYRSLVLLGAVTLTGAAFAASWETSSVRTATGGLIRVGMSSQEVHQELSHPQNKASATGARPGKVGKSKEVVIYRAEDGLYSISLAGGRVVKIVVTPARD